MKKTVLVLGGTSFIGSNLIGKLVLLGYNVIAGVRPNSPKITRLYSKYNNSIEYMDIDILNTDFCSIDKKKLKKIDYIYLASWNGTNSRDDIVANRQSADGLLDCVEYIIEHSSCKKIIQLGTQMEYGCLQGTVTEKTICKPETAYGKEKLRFYELADLMCRNRNISLIEYRIHSVFGKYRGGVLDNVISQLTTNKYCHMNTDCSQIFDYIYIDDCIDALILAVTRNLQGSIYNISSGNRYTLKEYLEKIKTILGTECHIEYGSFKDLSSADFFYDSTKFRNDTGWEPKFSFEDGIKEMLSLV